MQTAWFLYVARYEDLEGEGKGSEVWTAMGYIWYRKRVDSEMMEKDGERESEKMCDPWTNVLYSWPYRDKIHLLKTTSVIADIREENIRSSFARCLRDHVTALLIAGIDS